MSLPANLEARSLARPRPKVMLYSPDLDGHRQVYCERWARVLLSRGHEVCVAASFAGLGGERLLPEFTSLSDEPRFSRIDVSCFPEGGLGIDAHQLAGLILRVGAEVTVLLEADDLLGALYGQIGSHGTRLPGRRVGLFIRSTNYLYPQPAHRPLRAQLGWLRRLPSGWKEWPRLFHELLLPRHGLLDAALCLDEYFVARHAGSHAWMPDLYQTSEQTCQPTDRSLGAESDDLTSRLRTFTAAHAGREVLVYFGKAYARRGYDTLLQLAASRRACFVHCGQRNVDQYDHDVARLRKELEKRGDLFETTSYVADFAVAERFLSAAPAIALPYRHHLGSSGVMLQALHAGRPVLVPNEGLMAGRVRDHGLGAVYDPGDHNDLEAQLAALWKLPPRQFAAAIERFLSHFSQDRVERAIVAAVDESMPACDLPLRARG